MAVEGVGSEKDVEQELTGNLATSALGGTVARGGVVCTMPTYPVTADDMTTDAADGVARPGVAPRKVGAEYTVQMLLNSLPVLIVDILALTATIAACRIAFYHLGLPVGMNVSACLLPIATGFILLNLEFGLYPGIRLSPVEEFRRLIVSVTAVCAVWAVGVAVAIGEGDSGIRLWRLWFLLAVYLCCLVVLPIAHAWTHRVLGRWRFWGFPTLICGNDAVAVRLYEWIRANPRLGLRPVGVIADPDSLEVDAGDAWYAGPWSAAQQIAIDKGVYWAVVVPPEDGATPLAELITDDLRGIPHIHVLSELTGLPDHGTAHQHFDGLTGIHLQHNLMLPLPRLTKRLMDVVVAIIGSLLLMPLLFYIAVAVKLSSRGPILYGHERIGRGGRRFLAWKFRTMFSNANEVLELYLEAHPELREEWAKDHKLRYDPRVTRIGRFLRVTSLDELPQLWNVVRGQMSLVGPRPIVTAEIPKYGPYFELYTMVKPGITGLWQVSGRNNTTYEERVQLDSYYVRNWSPWMDLYLLIRTIRIVLFAEGAY